MSYTVRSLSFSALGAIATSLAVLGITGGEGDAAAVLFMAFAANFLYTLLICPLAYMAAKAKVKTPAEPLPRRLLQGVTGAGLCFVALLVIIMVFDLGIERASMGVDTGVTFLEALQASALALVGWLVLLGRNGTDGPEIGARTVVSPGFPNDAGSEACAG
jgi:hypothetical protein